MNIFLVLFFYNEHVIYELFLNIVRKSVFEFTWWRRIWEEKASLTEKNIQEKSNEWSDSIIFHSTVDLHSFDILLFYRTMRKRGFFACFISISPIWHLCPRSQPDFSTPVDRARRVLSAGVEITCRI